MALESGCRAGRVVVPNTEACTTAGTLAAGAFCAETLTGKTRDMTTDQFFDYLEPQAARPDPENPGHDLPARGGAVCQTVDDWNAQKTALEQACRILGKNCTYELRLVIKAMQDMGDAFKRGFSL